LWGALLGQDFGLLYSSLGNCAWGSIP
jgi:hypothetical protein